MSLGILREFVLSLKGQFEIPLGNRPFLGQTMRDNSGISAMEEVEHAVIDPVELEPQLVQSVSQVLRGGPTELMSLLFKELQSGKAAVAGLSL